MRSQPFTFSVTKPARGDVLLAGGPRTRVTLASADGNATSDGVWQNSALILSWARVQDTWDPVPASTATYNEATLTWNTGGDWPDRVPLDPSAYGFPLHPDTPTG
jgi:hypothetical protein